MFSWWSEPEKPEEAKPVSDTEVEIEEPEHLTEEGRRKAWRMLSLIEAFLHQHPEPIALDEIDLLGRVAAGNHDLHDACAALRNGCQLDYLVIIFT